MGCGKSALDTNNVMINVGGNIVNVPIASVMQNEIDAKDSTGKLRPFKSGDNVRFLRDRNHAREKGTVIGCYIYYFNDSDHADNHKFAPALMIQKQDGEIVCVLCSDAVEYVWEVKSRILDNIFDMARDIDETELPEDFSPDLDRLKQLADAGYNPELPYEDKIFLKQSALLADAIFDANHQGSNGGIKRLNENVRQWRDQLFGKPDDYGEKFYNIFFD